MKISTSTAFVTGASGGIGRATPSMRSRLTSPVSGGILAAALAVVTVGAASAEALQPMAGRSVELGEMSGTLYYTAGPEGFHVVTTLAQGEAGMPVRFEAVLAPEQSVTISTPREAGAAPRALEISRRGNVVLLQTEAGTN